MQSDVRTVSMSTTFVQKVVPSSAAVGAKGTHRLGGLLEDRANADNTQSHTNGQERGIQLGGK